jgi:EpsI family protein
MSVARLVVLQLLLIGGLGSALLVPTHSQIQPAGVNMNLPESIGQWTGEAEKITQPERDELAPDTTFARKVYSNAFGDSILASIVLAGEDPDNSMHRPERCLPAQGWTVLDSSTRTIKAPQLPGGELRITRLHSERKVQDNQGKLHTIYNVNYYWFVGYHEITPSAIQRALFDIRDRVTQGVNQRWAYITVASVITEGLTKFGRSENATDEMVQSFVSKLFPQIVKPEVLARAANTQTSVVRR